MISSKKFCEEKFSCRGEKVEAEYECEECKSLQCKNCESKLHELAKFVFHSRKRLQPAPSFKLCQLSCEDRNYADVKCENCALNYCNICFEKMHSSGKRKAHTRIQLTDALLQAQVAPEGNLSPPTPEEFFDAVKPLSPMHSLETEGFVSMPLAGGAQDEESIAVIPETNLGDTSMTSEKSDRSRSSLPDVAPEFDLLEIADQSLTPKKDSAKTDSPKTTNLDEEAYKDCHSFLLVDQQEHIQVRETVHERKLSDPVDLELQRLSH